jgi:ferric iron reductase protein FhuF
MATWDRILAALRREKRDVSEAVDEAVDKANASLDRREREQRATPAEKMTYEQERIEQNDAELEAIRRKIEDR